VRRAVPLCLSLALAGCATPVGRYRSCGHVALDRTVLVLERGEMTSALARLAGGCLEESAPDLVLGQDQNLLDAHGRPFVGVNDDGTLREIDPDTLTISATFSVYPDQPAAGAVPHGIYGVDADASGELWISRDDLAALAVLRPDGSLDATVDLGDVDPDGLPNMNGILIQGGRAFVALGLLPLQLSDHAQQAGLVAVIDAQPPRARVGLIQLRGHNPVHKLIPIDDAGAKLIVATPGVHDTRDDEDGIDLIDTAAGTATQLISETALGGSVDEVVWAGPNEAYAIVLGPVPGLNPTSVVAFDPASGQVIRTLAQADFYAHTGLALAGDFVLVGDHSPGAPRIHVFSRATGAEQEAIVPQGEAPWGLLALPP
jgi:hypothetical protein